MTATATPEVRAHVVSVPRSEIARALRAAASIKAEHVRVDLAAENVTVTGYTPEVAVRVRLDAEGIDGAGMVYVPRVRFASVLPHLEPDVGLSVDDGHLKVESGESVFELRAAEPAPPKPEGMTSMESWKWGKEHGRKPSDSGHDMDAPGEAAATFEAPILVETLRRTLPFASHDETRPTLCMVALYPEQCLAAATDSFRFAVVRWGDGTETVEQPLMLRREACVSLRQLLAKKLGQVQIASTEKTFLARFEDTTWSITKAWPDAKYPSWRVLLPEEKEFTTTVKVDREDLLAAARSVGALSAGRAPLRLSVDDLSGATVRTVSSSAGKVTRRLATANVDGWAHEVGLNPDFTADICKVAPGERLTLKLVAPLQPMLVEAARDLYLLMPVRLDA